MSDRELSDFNYRVLSYIYYFTEKGTHPVVAHKLSMIVGIPWDEFYQAVRYLDRYVLVSMSPDQAIRMTPRGIAELEKPTHQHFPVTHNTTNINAPNLGNIQTGGTGNSQTILNNPVFDKAISSLLQLVQSSNLAGDEKEELVDEIVKVNKLAIADLSSGVIDKVRSRLDLIKTGLASADLLVKAGPFMKTIWNYFKSKYNL